MGEVPPLADGTVEPHRAVRQLADRHTAKGDRERDEALGVRGSQDRAETVHRTPTQREGTRQQDRDASNDHERSTRDRESAQALRPRHRKVAEAAPYRDHADQQAQSHGEHPAPAGFHRLGPGHDRRARAGCDFTDGEARPGDNFVQVFEIARLDTHSIGTCAERPDVDEHASRIGGIDA